MHSLKIRGGFHKYREISFLRGFAITTVVLMHLVQLYLNDGDIPNWLQLASTAGGTGGHAFLFCSGFGLYLSYLKEPLSFGAFVKKRGLKIYLPYVLFLLVHFFLPHGSADEGERFRMLLSHIFLYKMFIEKYVISFGLHLWFLSTIFQLYFLFLPLCRLRRMTGRRAFILIGCAVSAVWWVVMYFTGLGSIRIWGSFCFQYLWEFMLGMMAAEYLSEREEVSVALWKLALTAVLGLGLQAVMARRGGLAGAVNDMPALFGYTALALLLYCAGGRLVQPVFLWVSGISYEWFLVHVDAIMWSYYFMRQVTDNEFLRAAAAIVFSLAAALLLSGVIGLILPGEKRKAPAAADPA